VIPVRIVAESDKFTDEVLNWALKAVKRHPRLKEPCVNGERYLVLRNKIRRFAKRVIREVR
jgi:hypothetical protein